MTCAAERQDSKIAPVKMREHGRASLKPVIAYRRYSTEVPQPVATSPTTAKAHGHLTGMYLGTLLGTRIHERHEIPRKRPEVPANRTAAIWTIDSDRHSSDRSMPARNPQIAG